MPAAPQAAAHPQGPPGAADHAEGECAQGWGELPAALDAEPRGKRFLPSVFLVALSHFCLAPGEAWSASTQGSWWPWKA